MTLDPLAFRSALDEASTWRKKGARFVAGGQPDFRRQYVEVLPLPQTLPETKPPPRPPRAARWRQSFRWQDRLARPCRLGTTACAYQYGGCSRFSRKPRALGGMANTRGFFSRGSIFLWV